MKRSLVMLACVCVLTACAFGQVTLNVTSPTSGATVASPVKVAANASSSSGISGWRVYVDGASVYSAGATGSISTSLSMAAGSHNMVVRAWAKNGTYTSKSLSVTVPSSTSTGVSVNLSPSTVTLPTGGTQLFTQTVSGTTDNRVVYMVNGIAGGNSTIGTINWQGIYTAPATVPAGGTVTVGGQSLADSTKTGYATVTITSSTTTQPSTVAVAVSPTSAALQAGLTQQFTANVTGTTNTGVTWLVNGVAGGSSTTGTVSTSGLYTAPATVSSGATATVTARSNADTTKSASATISLVSAPTSVSISISPTSTSLSAGGSKQFTATVSGTTNTGVIWKVNGVQGGSASTGTVSSNGMYSAPSCSSTSSVTVSATSSYDTSKSASSSVSISGGTASGSGYYVSNSGSDSNDGSACHPWATIQYAASRATAGNVVHVAAGTYPGQVVFRNSGTSTSPIQFICDSYRQCKIVGQNYSSSWGKSAIVLTGSYVNITNFDISTDSNGAGGIYGYGAGYYQIIGNIVHDIPVPVCDGNGGGGIDPEATGSGGHSFVAQNTVTNIGNASSCGRANGIYLSGDGSVAVNNVVNNSWGSGFDIAHAAKNVVVAFNTVDTIKRGGGVGGDGVYMGCDSSACDYNTITNNILSNNQNAGIESYQGDSGDPASHNVYSNNLFYNNASTCSFPGGSTGLSCTSNKTGNPIYSIPGSNFKIMAGSAAIGTASTLKAPTDDFTGAARTSPNDIGAYIH